VNSANNPLRGVNAIVRVAVLDDHPALSPSSPLPSGRAPPTPSSRTWTASVPPSIRAVTAACPARACLATLVSASETSKYAVASTAPGSRPTDTSISIGTGILAASAATPARSPPW
jgi:hypothetical protein